MASTSSNLPGFSPEHLVLRLRQVRQLDKDALVSAYISLALVNGLRKGMCQPWRGIRSTDSSPFGWSIFSIRDESDRSRGGDGSAIGFRLGVRLLGFVHDELQSY